MKMIPLTQGKEALVDDHLFGALSRFKWFAHKSSNTFYAVRNSMVDGKRTVIYMHKEVFNLLGLPVPEEVDHRDRDSLNNQFENLRPATRQQNGRNRSKQSNNDSGFIGVSWSKPRKKWQAQANDADCKRIHLGRFENALEAALAYDEYVFEHFGEFAVLNFPEAFGRAA